MEKPDLKLSYVLKIGTNSKGEGLYEFIFSKDLSFSDEEVGEWGWNSMPAKGNSVPPSEDYIDTVLTLKTDKIALICLHELNDRTYIDGYYTIHALAHQDPNDDSGDMMYEELPIMVFHFGMTMKEVKDILYTRDLVCSEAAPEKAQPVVKLSKQDEDEEDDDDDMGLIV